MYNWLTRVESEPLEEAITDADRPGRPRRLSPKQQERLAEVLQALHSEAGYDADAWTPQLVRQLIQDEFSIEYLIPHIPRLMHDAGLMPADSGNCIHGVYQNIADLVDADQLVQRRMRDHLLELDMQGIIDAQKKAGGSVGGPAWHFKLQVNDDVVIDVLKDVSRLESIDFDNIGSTRASRLGEYS